MKEMIYKGSIDKVELLDKGKYKDYNYLIVSYGAHPCAYIEIEPNHPLYGRKDYDDINIKCHGGLTFSQHRKFPWDKKEHFYIGWDYAHYGDYVGDVLPGMEGKKWTTGEIKNEVIKVIEQVATWK